MRNPLASILKFLVPIALVGFLFFGVKTCSDLEIRRENIPSLPKNKINSIQYPWSVPPHLITEVTNYREAYDIDANDWIAQFSLDPSESQKLSGALNKIPEDKTEYRCISSIADWSLPHDICSYEKMAAAGFKGYYYNPSLCEAGCKQSIILWVNETSGEAYLVGAPD